MLSPIKEFANTGPEAAEALRERRDAAQHRQQVLVAAARLFAERGVITVTMDEIARAAGVGKGTLYRRYAHKGLLCLAVMDACWRHFQDQASDELARSADHLSPLARLDLFLGRLVNWIEDHVDWLGVIADAASGEQRGTLCRGPIFQWTHQVTTSLLDQAIRQGEATIDDPVYTADVLLAALDVNLYAYQRRARGYTPEQIHRGLGRIVDGLRSHAASGPGG
jgi:AcrR family transcriptional regulator